MGRYGGRFGHGSAPGVFDAVSDRRRPWLKYLGVFGITGALGIFFYYVYIESWTLAYSVYALTGAYAGVETPEIENKFSLRASVTGSIFLQDVVVPDANMLPGSTVGIKAPLSCLTQARYGITWGVIGAAQACLAQLLDYTGSRILFERPLAANQAVQIRLAEMARKITTAQLLSLQLGRLKDAGRMAPAQVSMAKWHNCRAALDVARDCRDLLGGAGISAEYVPIRHALNLESVITYEGTETIHQLSVGRELTGINAF